MRLLAATWLCREWVSMITLPPPHTTSSLATMGGGASSMSPMGLDSMEEPMEVWLLDERTLAAYTAMGRAEAVLLLLWDCIEFVGFSGGGSMVPVRLEQRGEVGLELAAL